MSTKSSTSLRKARNLINANHHQHLSYPYHYRGQVPYHSNYTLISRFHTSQPTLGSNTNSKSPPSNNNSSNNQPSTSTSSSTDPPKIPELIKNSNPYEKDYGLHSTADAKDLILSVLRSTATKREARQYISRYTPLIGRDSNDILKRREFVQNILNDKPKDPESSYFPSSGGSLLPTEPSLSETFDIRHILRVAIIKIRDIKSIDPDTFLKIGHTIVRLTKLGVSPIIVIDAGKERNDFLHLDNQPFRHYERAIMWKAAAVAGAIETASSDGTIRARPVEGLFELKPICRKGDEQSEHISSSSSSSQAYQQPITSNPLKSYTPVDTSLVNRLSFSIPNLMLSPLSHGIIPVVVPLAYDPNTSEEKLIEADDAVVFIVSELTRKSNHFLSVEKIIFIDPLGGIPSIERSGAHVYVNLSQELSDITAELHLGFIDPTTREINLSNLRTMDRALSLLPNSATGLITTPGVASLSSSRNPIIYNILTDRPIFSPSLPVIRKRTPIVETTIVRKGMPVILMKSLSGIDLLKESKVGTIDLNRLWDLIEDSFGRKLDVEKYLRRINGKVAGIIIAGDYEGAAIITWEEPPAQGGSSSSGEGEPVIISELERIFQAAEKKKYKRVAYLDKFAVRSSSQGAAGVADVVFKCMAITLFPDELLWRSRKTNPVNKWYFERSKGTVKLPKDSQWCAFWTGNNTRESERLQEYLNICGSIPSSWKD